MSNTCALLLHGGKPIRSPSSSVADFVRILPTQGQGADRRGYALLCTSRAHQNCSAGEPHSLPLLRVSDLRQCHLLKGMSIVYRERVRVCTTLYLRGGNTRSLPSLPLYYSLSTERDCHRLHLPTYLRLPATSFS